MSASVQKGRLRKSTPPVSVLFSSSFSSFVRLGATFFRRVCRDGAHLISPPRNSTEDGMDALGGFSSLHCHRGRRRIHKHVHLLRCAIAGYVWLRVNEAKTFLYLCRSRPLISNHLNSFRPASIEMSSSSSQVRHLQTRPTYADTDGDLQFKRTQASRVTPPADDGSTFVRKSSWH